MKALAVRFWYMAVILGILSFLIATATRDMPPQGVAEHEPPPHIPFGLPGR